MLPNPDRCHRGAVEAVEQPVLPDGFRFRTAGQAGPAAAVQAHVDAWAPSAYTAEGYADHLGDNVWHALCAALLP